MADWWPFGSHSVFQGELARLDPPAGPGSRIVEHARDGRSQPWGEVLAWEPPRRVVFTFGAYAGWDALTEVEVTFAPEGDGTRVSLEHRGWERLGERGRTERPGYDHGWDEVFVRAYGGFAGSAAAA
jgi:uncharacterized protein YndB with AHSA1/START domain